MVVRTTRYVEVIFGYWKRKRKLPYYDGLFTGITDMDNIKMCVYIYASIYMYICIYMGVWMIWIYIYISLKKPKTKLFPTPRSGVARF